MTTRNPIQTITSTLQMVATTYYCSVHSLHIKLKMLWLFLDGIIEEI